MKEQATRILLVADNLQDLAKMERALKAEGARYDIQVANTLAAARLCLAQGGIDLVLFTQSLPDGTGLELQSHLNQIPSIFLMTSSDVAIARETIQSGALNYLLKDSQHEYISLLPIAIENILQAQRGGTEVDGDHEQLEEEIQRRTLELQNENEHLNKELVGREKTIAQLQDNEKRYQSLENELERYRINLEENSEARMIELRIANKKMEQEILERKLVENHLRASENRYRALVENSLPYICEIDLEGRFISMNASGLQKMGVQYESDIYSMFFLDIVSDEDQENVRQIIELAKLGNSSEFEFKATDNSILQASIVPIKDETGAVTILTGLAQDITLRIQAEEALRTNEEELNGYFNASSAGLTIFDRELRYVRVNESLAKINGLAISDHIGKTMHEVVPKLAPAIEPLYQKVFDTEQPILNAEIKGETPRNTGVQRYWTVSFFPIKNQDQQVEAVGAVVIEITQQKLVEAQLRREQLFIESTLEAMEDTFFVFRLADNQPLRWNKSFREASGYTDEEIAAMKPEDFYETDAIQLWEKSTDQQRNQNYTNKIAKLKTKQGELIPFEYSTFLIKDQQGIPTAVCAIGRDIRERTRAEKKIARYARIFEESINEIYLFDATTLNFTQVNRVAAQNLGYSLKELENMTPLDIKPDFTLAAFNQLITPLREGEKQKILFETVHQRKDGSLYDVEVHLQLLEDGQEDLFVAVIEDTTERKLALEKLKTQTDEVSRLYRATGSLLASTAPNLTDLTQSIVETVLIEFEHTNCSLILIDEHSQKLNRIAVAGPYAEEVSKGELRLGSTGLVPQSIRSGEIIYAPDVLENPNYVPNWKSARSEMVVPLKADSRVIGVIDIQSSSIDAFSKNDERMMALFAERAAMALEITRLFRNANKRLDRLSSLHNIIQSVTSSLDIYVTLNVLLNHIVEQLDIDAVTVWLYQPSQKVIELVAQQGFQNNELIPMSLQMGEGYSGKAALEQRTIQISNLQQNSRLLNNSVLAGEGFTAYIGVPLIAKNKLVGVLEIYNHQPLDPNPEWMSFLETLTQQTAIAIDHINLFSEMEDLVAERTFELNRTLDELWEVNQIKTDFLSTAAHELRTPLTTIKGFSELLLTRKFEEEDQARYMSMINEQASHLATIVDDLLDISRLEAGRGLEMTPEPIDMAILINETLHSFIALNPNHQFRVLGPQEYPPIRGDPFMLAQVIKNVISNAVKYSPDGGAVIVRNRIVSGSLEISVQDEGIGMTEEQQEHLFEKFYRADSSDTSIGGTGLGLVICKTIIELHGGKIWITSKAGVGTTTFIWLPIHGEKK